MKQADIPLQELQPIERTHMGAGEKEGRNSREELLWTDHKPPFPIHTVSLDREEVEELGIKE